MGVWVTDDDGQNHYVEGDVTPNEARAIVRQRLGQDVNSGGGIGQGLADLGDAAEAGFTGGLSTALAGLVRYGANTTRDLPGFQALARALGVDETVNTGLDVMSRGATPLERFGRENTASALESLSPEAWRERDEARLTPGYIGQVVAESAPSMIPGIVASLATRNPAFLSVIEGAQSTGQAEVQMRQRAIDHIIDNWDEFVASPEGQRALRETGGDAEQAADLVATRAAGALPVIIGGLVGAVGLGSEPVANLIGRLAPNALSRVPEFLRPIILRAASEAGEEAVQSPVETIGGNIGQSRIDPEQDLLEGAGESAVIGGVAGALGGAGFGAAQSASQLASRRPPRPDADQAVDGGQPDIQVDEAAPGPQFPDFGTVEQGEAPEAAGEEISPLREAIELYRLADEEEDPDLQARAKEEANSLLVPLLRERGVSEEDITVAWKDDALADLAETVEEDAAQPQSDYERAIDAVRRAGTGSTSLVQRTLGIGYNAAANIIARMEQEGILSAPDNAGRRTVIQMQPAQETPVQPSQPAEAPAPQPQEAGASAGAIERLRQARQDYADVMAELPPNYDGDGEDLPEGTLDRFDEATQNFLYEAGVTLGNDVLKLPMDQIAGSVDQFLAQQGQAERVAPAPAPPVAQEATLQVQEPGPEDAIAKQIEAMVKNGQQGSAVGSERLVHTQEVAGSSPAPAPIDPNYIGNDLDQAYDEAEEDGGDAFRRKALSYTPEELKTAADALRPERGGVPSRGLEAIREAQAIQRKTKAATPSGEVRAPPQAQAQRGKPPEVAAVTASQQRNQNEQPAPKVKGIPELIDAYKKDMTVPSPATMSELRIAANNINSHLGERFIPRGLNREGVRAAAKAMLDEKSPGWDKPPAPAPFTEDRIKQALEDKQLRPTRGEEETAKEAAELRKRTTSKKELAEEARLDREAAEKKTAAEKKAAESKKARAPQKTAEELEAEADRLLAEADEQPAPRSVMGETSALGTRRPSRVARDKAYEEAQLAAEKKAAAKEETDEAPQPEPGPIEAPAPAVEAAEAAQAESANGAADQADVVKEEPKEEPEPKQEAPEPSPADVSFMEEAAGDHAEPVDRAFARTEPILNAYDNAGVARAKELLLAIKDPQERIATLNAVVSLIHNNNHRGELARAVAESAKADRGQPLAMSMPPKNHEEFLGHRFDVWRDYPFGEPTVIQAVFPELATNGEATSVYQDLVKTQIIRLSKIRASIERGYPTKKQRERRIKEYDRVLASTMTLIINDTPAPFWGELVNPGGWLEQKINSGELDARTWEDVRFNLRTGAFRLPERIGYLGRDFGPAPFYGYHWQARKSEMAMKLRERLNERGLKDVAVRVVDAIEENDLASATYMARMISISMQPDMMTDGRDLAHMTFDDAFKEAMFRMDHEMVHAMRQLGLFTDEEWRTLHMFARTHGVNADGKVVPAKDGVQSFTNEIKSRPFYQDQMKAFLPEEQKTVLEEEGVATAVQWLRRMPPGKPKTLLSRIVNFLRDVMSAVWGPKTKTAAQLFNNAQRIIEHIDAGRLGKRRRDYVKGARTSAAAVINGPVAMSVEDMERTFNAMNDEARELIRDAAELGQVETRLADAKRAGDQALIDNLETQRELLNLIVEKKMETLGEDAKEPGLLSALVTAIEFGELPGDVDPRLLDVAENEVTKQREKGAGEKYVPRALFMAMPEANQFKAFLDGPQRNAWIDVGDYHVYVRKSRRMVGSSMAKVFDVASIQRQDGGSSDKGKPASQGQFKRLMGLAEVTAKEAGYDAVYVESVVNDFLPEVLERYGYVRDGSIEPPSYIKRLTRAGGGSLFMAMPSVAGPELDQNMLYSAALEQAKRFPEERSTRIHMLRWLAKQEGVKKEELDQLDMEAFVAIGGRATRDDLVQWIRDHRLEFRNLTYWTGANYEVGKRFAGFQAPVAGDAGDLSPGLTKGGYKPKARFMGYRAMSNSDGYEEWAVAVPSWARGGKFKGMHFGPNGTIAHWRVSTNPGHYHVEEFQSDYFDAEPNEFLTEEEIAAALPKMKELSVKAQRLSDNQVRLDQAHLDAARALSDKLDQWSVNQLTTVRLDEDYYGFSDYNADPSELRRIVNDPNATLEDLAKSFRAELFGQGRDGEDVTNFLNDPDAGYEGGPIAVARKYISDIDKDFGDWQDRQVEFWENDVSPEHLAHIKRAMKTDTEAVKGALWAFISYASRGMPIEEAGQKALDEWSHRTSEPPAWAIERWKKNLSAIKAEDIKRFIVTRLDANKNSNDRLELRREFSRLETAVNSGRTKNTPFEGTWPEMLFRQAFMRAVAGGYNTFSWNSGDAIRSIAGMGTYKGNIYDERIPKYARKWLKPFGVRIEKVELPAARQDVTDEFAREQIAILAVQEQVRDYDYGRSARITDKQARAAENAAVKYVTENDWRPKPELFDRSQRAAWDNGLVDAIRDAVTSVSPDTYSKERIHAFAIGVRDAIVTKLHAHEEAKKKVVSAYQFTITPEMRQHFVGDWNTPGRGAQLFMMASKPFTMPAKNPVPRAPVGSNILGVKDIDRARMIHSEVSSARPRQASKRMAIALTSYLTNFGRNMEDNAPVFSPLKGLGAAIKVVGQNLTTLGNLQGQPYFLFLRSKVMGAIGEFTEVSEKLAALRDRMTTESVNQFDEYMLTRGADPSIITDDEVRAAAIQAKDILNRLGEENVRVGNMTPAAYKKYRDRYLPRKRWRYIEAELRNVGQKLGRQGYLRERLPGRDRQIFGAIDLLRRAPEIEQLRRDFTATLQSADPTSQRKAQLFLAGKLKSVRTISDPQLRRELPGIKKVLDQVEKDIDSADLISLAPQYPRGFKTVDARKKKQAQGEAMPAGPYRMGQRYGPHYVANAFFRAARKNLSIGGVYERAAVDGLISDPVLLSSFAVAEQGRDAALFHYLSALATFNKSMQQIDPNWQDLGWIHPSDMAEYNGRIYSSYALREELGQAKKHHALISDPFLKKVSQEEITKLEQILSKTRQLSKGELGSDYIALPESKRYGTLAGLIVHRGIYHDLMGTFGSSGGKRRPGEIVQQSIFGRFMAWYKQAMTSLNFPSGHARAFLQNTANLYMSGVGGHDVGLMGLPSLNLQTIFGHMIPAAADMVNDAPMWREALEDGVRHGTFTAIELRHLNTLVEKLKRVEKLKLKGRAADEANAADTIMKHIAEMPGKAGDLFQLWDTWSRYTKYRHERLVRKSKRGDAIIEANEWQPDYSILPEWGRALRETVVPFWTIFYKLSPKMIDQFVAASEDLRKGNVLAAADKTARFLSFAMMVAGSHAAIAMLLMGLDDDEAESMWAAFPKWARDNIGAIPVGLDSNNQITLGNLGFQYAWTNWINAARSMSRGEYKEAFGAMGVGMPAVDVISVFTTGVDPYTGYQLFDPELDDAATKLRASFGYLFRTLTPPTLRGVADPFASALTGSETGEMGSGVIARAVDAAFGDGLSPSGRPIEDPQYIIGRFLGANFNTFDPLEQHVRDMQRFNRVRQERVGDETREIRSLRRQIAALEEDRTLTPERRQSLVDRKEAQIERIRARAQRVGQTLGEEQRRHDEETAPARRWYQDQLD